MGSAEAGDELAAVFARLTDALDPRSDVIDTMDVLVQAAVTFTPAVEACVVLADSSGRLHVLGSTSERTADVEEAQLGTERGPCLDSYRSGRTVEVSDLSGERERWPEFVEIAEQRGFKASFAVPLTLRGDHLGALNLFFDVVDPISDWDAVVAQTLAQVATAGIVQRRKHKERADRAVQLQQALNGRIIIEQAKGVLAFQHDVTIDHAFTLIRRHANEADAHISEIASQIVNRRLSI
jgi:GAF domain/ANTAR domain